MTILCQYENEAHAIFEALKERLSIFGLETAEDKTKIMPFGRNSTTRDTFDFLGFTHVNSKTRHGKYTVGHKISKKKKKQFKSNLKRWVKENRNMEFMTFMLKLNRKLIGTNNYYSVSGSIKEVRGLYNHAFWAVFKWMNRRSQRKSFSVDKFRDVWKALIKPPYIHVNIWNVGGVIYN